MDAIQVISQIISSITTDDSPPMIPSFYYGNDAEKNLQGDNESFPTVFMDFPFETFFEIKQSGYIQERCQVDLLFCDLTKQDATPAEHLIVIREMTVLAKKFMAQIQDNQYIRSFEITKGTGVINLFDVNVSGLFLQTVIEFVNEQDICT